MQLENLLRVCDNAMKQYKRTRPDPSAASIRRAKFLPTHSIHPLVIGHLDRKAKEQHRAQDSKTLLPSSSSSSSTLLFSSSSSSSPSVGVASGTDAAATAEYLHSLGKFRPKTTVFEVDAKTTKRQERGLFSSSSSSGGSGSCGGRGAESVGMAAMREVRKRHRVLSVLHSSAVRLTDESLSVRGSGSTSRGGSGGGSGDGSRAQEGCSDMKGDDGDDNDEEEATENGAVGDEGLRWLKVAASASVVAGTAAVERKRRISKAERRHMTARKHIRSSKRQQIGDAFDDVFCGGGGGGDNDEEECGIRKDFLSGSSGDDATSSKRGRDGLGERKVFRDEVHYIGYGTGGDVERGREARLLADTCRNAGNDDTSGSSGRKKEGDKAGGLGGFGPGFGGAVVGGGPKHGLEAVLAGRLEDGVLDLTADEQQEMAKQQKLWQWDTRKRKYVKRSLAEMAEGRGSKKVRTESGVQVLKRNGGAKQKKGTPVVGELYEKWKAKSNKTIGGAAVDEIIASGAGRGGVDQPPLSSSASSSVSLAVRMPLPKGRQSKHVDKYRAAQERVIFADSNTTAAKEELRSVNQIHDQRNQKARHAQQKGRGKGGGR